MSVIIPGMDMPRHCGLCPFSGPNYCYAKGEEDIYAPKPCPLIELPTHGRLVDCETLKDDLAVLLERNANLIDDWLAYTLDDVIDGTPTIIEAEEGEVELSELRADKFAEEMREALQRYGDDEEIVHRIGDGLMCDLLRELGYGKGVDIFEDMSKWYA